MEIVIVESPERVSATAAEIIAGLVSEKPNAVLGLCTGSSPKEVYAELVLRHRAGLDFSRVTTFNLDEYVGLPHTHPASYHRQMAEQLFDHVNVTPERVHIPDGMTKDIARTCADYEAAISAAGGIDLQLLGIGENGHIAFNEPTSALESRTRLKTLFARPGLDASLPRHVITMGIGTILDARHCVLIAFGQRKARAVAQMVEGPLTAFVPASALQRHPLTTVIIDEAAASELTLAEQYREIQRLKPDGQRGGT